MKRSEMVRFIHNFIEGFSNSLNAGDGHLCADKLLRYLELKGMLPPIISLCDGETIEQEFATELFEQAWEDYLARWEIEEEE